MATYKKVVVVFLALALVAGVGLFFLLKQEPAPTTAPAGPAHEVIGHSVEGRAIEAYTFGSGPQHYLFVGGIHGGYEWNSVLLAYQMLDYFNEHVAAVPQGVRVSIIPSANPDGIYKVVGKEGRFSAADVAASEVDEATARFNANGVDLNRNFDCKWQPTSMWRGTVVSAGPAPFSEPEARAIRDFVLARRPSVAVFLHSQANAVYASECEAGILPATLRAMSTYATAAGYPAVDTFDAYTITGDAEGWLASLGIPAITVELSTHETIEWEKNLAGVRALLGM